MKTEFFLEIVEQELELGDEKINVDTELTSLENYDSMSKLFLITIADEHFGKEILAEQVDEITTVRNFMELIGVEHFEEEIVMTKW